MYWNAASWLLYRSITRHIHNCDTSNTTQHEAYPHIVGCILLAWFDNWSQYGNVSKETTWTKIVLSMRFTFAALIGESLFRQLSIRTAW